MIIQRIPAWVTETNAYLVAREKGGTALVVDAPPDPDRIGQEAAQMGLALVGMVLTHGHVDHTGGSGKLSADTGAVTYVHPDDDFLTLHPIDQLRTIFGMVPPGDYQVAQQRQPLSHQQELVLAGVALQVRHTPGHTPGHCCLWWEEEGILFSGDQLFAGSIGRTDLPGGSYPALMESMASQVMTLDDEVRVLPGHGPETTIGRERRSNPFLTGA